MRISTGSGYADDSSFAPYTVLCEPLADRESRVLGAAPERGHPGTCYRAYSLKLAAREWGGSLKRSDLVILVSHGGGTEVWSVKAPYDGGVMLAAILALPEVAQYGVLWTLYQAGLTAFEQARTETRGTWAQAFVDKRIRVRRKAGRRTVEILPLYAASAIYEGQPPTPVPGAFRDPESALAAARAAHPDAARVTASPIP